MFATLFKIISDFNSVLEGRRCLWEWLEQFDDSASRHNPCRPKQVNSWVSIPHQLPFDQGLPTSHSVDPQ